MPGELNFQTFLQDPDSLDQDTLSLMIENFRREIKSICREHLESINVFLELLQYSFQALKTSARLNQLRLWKEIRETVLHEIEAINVTI